MGRPLPELLIGEQPDTGPGASATRLPHEWETVLTLRHAFHDWPVRRPRDETHFVLFSGKPYHDSEDRFAGYRGVGQDRTKTLDLEQRLTHLAKHDALTGLMNRTAFQRHMSNALAEARLRGTRHALCYLDLDQFKIVNDTAGHAAGDELLRQLTALLRERIAATDTLARLGGDEFALLLENRTQDQALAIAEDLAGLVREFRFVWAGRRYETGVSIGVAAVTAEADSVEDLLSRAHAACYSAKELGHHRVHHYEGSSRAEETYSELRRAAELPELLRQKRFCLYAQPIVPLALAGGRPHWEILLRSVDAAGQTVGAGPIITAAERFHVMPALDRWVIARALTQAQSVFGADSNTVIGINVSGQSFAEPGLADYVVACLRDSGVAPARVCFEITETAAVYHLAQASQFISALKNLGCLFALDDFGSGVSSFNYLKNLPVDFLKIDGSFVRNIVTDRIDRAMVAAMNEVGHMMGIRTVAEFVETPAIGEVLTGIGVDFGQGYAIGRPVPLDTLRET
ncbi:MAG: EAL domain-containing protein [Gammaproteobacteria bacterium]